MSDEAKIATTKAWQGVKCSQARSLKLDDPGLERSEVLPGGIQENMIDLLGGYLPGWVRVLLLRPLLYAWSFGWFLCPSGLICFAAVFLTVCVGIMGGNLCSVMPATHSLFTASGF